MNFAKDDPNAVVVMYPTGGYGHFLYLLLSEYIDCTVKISQTHFDFDQTGHSHQVAKHVESFLLGSNFKNFKYSYTINNDVVAEQIAQGKKFLVIGDMGIRGDNVKWLLRYFPCATIIRIHASTFEEKLVTWFNCMTKTLVSNELYPGSLLTTQGIQKWANRTQINDQDAVDCMTEFFCNDFSPFGQYFNAPSDLTINVEVKEFFTVSNIQSMIKRLAQALQGTQINQQGLQQMATKFVSHQLAFDLLDQRRTHYPLIARAIEAYEKTFDIKESK